MKRKQYDQLLRMLQQQSQAALQAAQQQSPWEIEAQNRYNQTKSFLDSRDYRNLPTGVHIPMLSLAEGQRMRNMMRGTNAGQSAKGMDSRMLASQRELSDNQFVQDWGGAYEEQIGNLMGQQDNTLSFLQGAHANRMNTGLQGSLGLFNATAQNIKPKQSFWSSFLPGLLQGGASAAMSFI
ncbi:hypothetical protein [Geitlerinema calcuttense]|uniref:Uncharacterized protein n=1 Tax=Geitlerinema calcuttense NRMC-F 0142 TaxID=2922238 RepID=A0ABT7LV36_9CYAN|nr:hypothetical protein [Geitlerinema calcuttense]MDL5055900.1 hypothetical protein [Geitlerinema calcuttense NRMC-F 0142]